LPLARANAVADSEPVNAPSPLRLDHIVVPVRDAQEARRFYRDTLGLPLVAALSGDDWSGRRWLMMVFGLSTGGQHLVAVAFDGLDRELVELYPRDARHVALAVTSVAQWESWRARLGALATFWEEKHGDQQSVYVVDPSGNVLEITYPETTPFAVKGESPDVVVDRWSLDGKRT
jgi:catechol 2,3-dioxygenase-like lactoylglutathione lyase family enzyme